MSSTLPAIAETAEQASLPALVDRAATRLAEARTAAEVLEAREAAGLAYDAAKRTARLAKAKGAHDELVAAAYHAQADALAIEAQAKRRLAEEYDAAQERGEVAGRGGDRGNQHAAKLPDGKVATTADIGLSHKQIHEARMIRDAEAADPGIVARTVKAQAEAGKEPTRAAIKHAITDVGRATGQDDSKDIFLIRAGQARGFAEACGRLVSGMDAVVFTEHSSQLASVARATAEAWSTLAQNLETKL